MNPRLHFFESHFSGARWEKKRWIGGETWGIGKRLVTGHDSGGVLVQPDGKRAYESCASDNYVVVLDLKTLQVVGHIHAGNGPDGLAWAVQR